MAFIAFKVLHVEWKKAQLQSMEVFIKHDLNICINTHIYIDVTPVVVTGVVASCVVSTVDWKALLVSH